MKLKANNIKYCYKKNKNINIHKLKIYYYKKEINLKLKHNKQVNKLQIKLQQIFEKKIVSLSVHR